MTELINIKRYFLLSLSVMISLTVSAQVVKLSPAEATADEEITITFNAAEGTGGLVGAESVYMHSGVVTEPNGTDWEYVIGNWGQDDGIGKMTPVDGEEDMWQITLTPRDYYSIPAGENVFRLSMVFRDAAGQSEGKGTPGEYDWGTVTSGGDIFVNLSVDAYVNIVTPAQSEVFLAAGQALPIHAEASDEVSEMLLLVNDNQKASVTSGTEINFDYEPAEAEAVTIKVQATINGISVEVTREVQINLRSEVEESALPAGVIKGINYTEDPSKVTLVLEAPQKEFVYVVGDFNNWQIDDSYLMKRTPDGELFWLELSGLTEGQPYVFQYWVEGVIKIGDPYAAQVADPWNDSYIPDDVFPDLPVYDKTEHGIATVLETGKSEFVWADSEAQWTPPRKDELVIYELLVRDFVGSHSYQDVIDSLSYLKNLGINAIELMPIMEFEGNNSWGYNPSYFFAADKYYGTENDLKSFIEAAHQHGIAVILDMVLNHAFGQNAMVRMYWDETNNTVSAESPWFNPVAKHPFNVGFDFNHESQYTKDFVDTVNHYWINEFHFDGYRFDLSKGFTQTDYGDDVNAWSGYDQGRIDLLQRMANEIWSYDDDAYVILEHFGAGDEETVLANSGMLLWRGMTHAYAEALKGNGSGLSGARANTHVSFMESHDEQRIAYEMKVNGDSEDGYDTQNKLVFLERLKMAAAFHFLQAGPKMIWQFGELGYDIDINYIDRLAEKPLPWGEGNLGYYEDELRQYVYDAYAAVLDLRNQYPVAIRTASFSGDLSGSLKHYSLTHPEIDIKVMGNFGLETDKLDPSFPKTGTWYDYFSGEEVNISDVHAEMELKPGEFHVYTSKKVSEGFPGVVLTYENPVTVDPEVFGLTDEIRIVFDATKASPDGTNGLIGVEKVYMHAGLVTDSPDGTELTHVVGTFTDDGVGEMSKVSAEDELWEITLTPEQYFDLAEGESAFRVGIYFRDASNENVGKGFRDEVIYLDILQDGELVTVSPAEFGMEDEITITFNAALGNRGLADADKVYMHSGLVTANLERPTGNSWSNVVGIWGEDNGVGEMTNIAGTDLWEITITPRDYYDFEGNAYWLALVFRDASGSSKGSAPAGELSGGFIDTSGDIYVAVSQGAVVTEASSHTSLSFYPNPAHDFVIIPNPTTTERNIQVYTVAGQLILDRMSTHERLDLSHLRKGIYLLKVKTNNEISTHRMIIKD